MAILHLGGSARPRFWGRIGLGILLGLVFALGTVTGMRPAFASGGGAPADYFIQTATAANTFGDYTLINNSWTNENPNAFLEVTANWNPNGVYRGFDNHQVGVWYDAGAGEWAIFNEDESSMPIGAAFNVYVIKSAVGWGVIHTVTTSNSDGYITFIDDSEINGDPSMDLLVTQNWNPPGSGGVYNNHAIGVWYDAPLGEWTIYNEDRSPLPLGASFNVDPATYNQPGNAWTQVATSSNTSGDSTCISVIDGGGESEADGVVFSTHIYSGYFTDVSAVWYDASLNEWCVFDGSGNPMPLGATFSVSATQY